VAVFLANVGANAGHRVRSPLFPDGSFTLHPIPERVAWAPPMRRLPRVWGDLAVHLDPDLDGEPPTYGDNCRTAGRAFSLRRAAADDLILFIARLHSRAGDPPGFFLVGSLHVVEVRADLTGDPGPGWWDGNAHVRRARAGGSWDSFWVFRGDPAASRFFERAVPFRRAEADRVFDGSWRWRAGRSELQTIGSYTRAVRRLTGAAAERLRDLAGTRDA
jgi:hypothetical protein